MFKEEILIPFEDDEFKAPKEYDKLLSTCQRHKEKSVLHACKGTAMLQRT